MLGKYKMNEWRAEGLGQLAVLTRTTQQIVECMPRSSSEEPFHASAQTTPPGSLDCIPVKGTDTFGSKLDARPDFILTDYDSHTRIADALHVVAISLREFFIRNVYICVTVLTRIVIVYIYIYMYMYIYVVCK